MICSQRGEAYDWYYQCSINIIITVTVVFGTMTVMFLRMRRVYRVFSLYDSYLDD